MLSLKRRLQATSSLSEAGALTSTSLTLTSHQPALSSYSLYGTATTTNSTSFLYSYPSTLSYYGNSLYSGSYTYSSQSDYGGLVEYPGYRYSISATRAG